jgi:hypothetical protein
MRFRSVLVALSALTALGAALPADAQSIGRQMDLLRLEEQAGAVLTALSESEFKACEAKLPTLKAIMADPRFDRMRQEIRRPFLFSVILCSEIKDRPLGLEAARRLEPMATEPMEIGAVQTIQISDAIARDAMVDATRRFLKLLDAQPGTVAVWRPGMVGVFTDYLDEDPDLALTALARITAFAWKDPRSLRAAKNEWALAYGWQLGDKGRATEAATAVAGADDPRVLMYVAADRRFEKTWTAALADTGDIKEAEAVSIEAIGPDEARADSTDARMNWGGRLLDLARPRDVLKVLEGIDLDYVTPYGQAWIDAQKACAWSDIDPKTAEPLVESVRTQRDGNPGALSEALLCANRLDEAAALLVWRLQSPEHRAGALDPFWTARPPPVITPWLAEFNRRRLAIQARPEVQAALAKVGRPVTTPLGGDYWGGF